MKDQTSYFNLLPSDVRKLVAEQAAQAAIKPK